MESNRIENIKAMYEGYLEIFEGICELGRTYSIRPDFGIRDANDIERVVTILETSGLAREREIEASKELRYRIMRKGEAKVGVTKLLDGLKDIFYYSSKAKCILPHGKTMNRVAPSRANKKYGSSLSEGRKIKEYEHTDSLSDGSFREHDFISGQYDTQEALGLIDLGNGASHKLNEETSYNIVAGERKIAQLTTLYLVKEGYRLAEQANIIPDIPTLKSKLYLKKDKYAIKSGSKLNAEESAFCATILEFAGVPVDFDRPLINFNDSEGEEFNLTDLLIATENSSGEREEDLLTVGNIASLSVGLVDDMFKTVKNAVNLIRKANKIKDFNKQCEWLESEGVSHFVEDIKVTAINKNNYVEVLESAVALTK